MWREEKQPTLSDVKEQAREASKNCGCVQHVNKRHDGTYHVSDWYDSDSTIASYEDGKEK